MTMNFTTLKASASKFKKDESGATAIEYALMIALVGAVMIASVKLLGESTDTKFSGVAADITAAGT